MEDMDDILEEFLVETYEGLDQLDRDLITLEQEPAASEVIAQIFRTVHTIKGSGSFLALERLSQVAHGGESLLSLLRDGRCVASKDVTDALLAVADAIRGILAHVENDRTEGDEDHTPLLRQLEELVHRCSEDTAKDAAGTTSKAPPAEPGRGSVAANSLRVDVELLDKLMNLVGELVLARNQILQVTGALEESELLGTCQRLNLVTTELQEGVMKARMQAIGSAWTKFPRVVRDLGVSCGKQVQLQMSGQETELDKTIIESIKDPLTHAIRNAVDHGIEAVEDREAAGKPAAGTLHLRAFHEGGQVNIEVIDDGKGIDPQAVRDKAVAKGVLSVERAAGLSDREAVQLIMQPGFSTAEKVTNVSGRGVGMDVVKTNIEKIGGTVDVQSVVGRGTTLRIKIPLTLAIIPALIVTSGGDRFAIPQANLLELVRLDPEQGGSGVEYIDGAPVHRLRGELLPLVYLDRELGQAADVPPRERGARAASLVVLQADGTQFGLVVEDILDTEEIVVKPLGRQLGGIDAFAGAAIMGDGRVALILDVIGLAEQGGLLGDGRKDGAAQAVGDSGVVTGGQSWLLVGVGERRVALELASVARLEELSTDDVESTGGREVVQYRGEIMPVIRLAQRLGATSTGDAHEALPVVVMRGSRGRSVGVVVDRILDIVDEDLEVWPHARGGVLRGAATLQGRVTDLLDVDALTAGEFCETEQPDQDDRELVAVGEEEKV